MQEGEAQTAVIYARISKNDPKVPKVEVQEADCRRLAEMCGYAVTTVYVDDGISASTFKNRPGWQQLLADTAAGRHDVILAQEEERFSRQPMEKETLQVACATAGVTWHTVRGGHVDPATADGEFMSGLSGLLARREVRRKAERQRSGNDARRLRGEPMTGVRPFGFELNRIDHRDDEVAEIRWAYAHVLDGGSLGSIQRAWAERGIKTTRGNDWSYATVKQLLRRPRNAGLVDQAGEVLENVQAVWEPIVKRQDWDACRALLSRPERRTTDSREPRWLCAGIVNCWCGSIMRSGSGSNRTERFSIYRCAFRVGGIAAGKHASIQPHDLDPLVRDAVVSAFLMSPPSSLPVEAAGLAEVQRARTRLGEVTQGIADLLAMVGNPGVNSATISKRTRELGVEAEELEAVLEEHERQNAHAAMLLGAHAALWEGKLPDRLSQDRHKRVSIADAAVVKQQLGERFDSLPLQQRRTLVRTLLVVTVNPWSRGKSSDRVAIKYRGEVGAALADEA